MKHLILLLLINFSFQVHAQWIKMHDDENFTLLSIYFVDDNTGFAVGGRKFTDGVIMKTNDKGQTWTTLHVNNKLDCIYFPSKDTGYAVGENATIMKTIDGGLNWNYQNSGILTDFEITSVFFTDNNTGYVSPVNGPSTVFLKTTDGGTTWQNISNNSVNGWAIYFSSKYVGYTISSSIFKTIDGGLNWNEFPIPGNFYGSLYFLNDSLGYSAGFEGVGDSCNNNTSIIKTIDGGLTWQDNIFTCTNSFQAIYFPCKYIGYVGGWDGIYKTNDSGNSWFLQNDSVARNTKVYSIYCADSNICYAVGSNGRIIKTINGGGYIGIDEEIYNNENNISIYPNPISENFINVCFPFIKIGKYQIVNILGEVIMSDVIKNTDQIIIDAASLGKGCYIIQVLYDGKNITRKFIKQ